jgi:hypothetical protein
MSKPSLNRLRQKGSAYYFDTQRMPRYWIPLGSDRTSALRQCERLIAAHGASGTVARMVTDCLDHRASGGRGSFGKPVRPQTLEQYRTSGKHLMDVCGDTKPEEAAQADVAKYLRACKRTRARGEIGLPSSADQHACGTADYLQSMPVGMWWRAACKAAGVENAHWHDIRARAGTDADAGGADPQKLLGHTSPPDDTELPGEQAILTVDPVRRKRG